MRTISLIFLLFITFELFGQNNQTDSNGLCQGLWKKQQSNGKLLYEGNFVDGKPIGEWKRYHEGGQLKALIIYSEDTAKTQLFDLYQKKEAEGIFINQKKEGTWTYFSNNNKISEENFTHGIKNGQSKKYYDTGEVLEMADWKNGIQEGNYQILFKTGEPYLQCKMANNQRNGLCLIYFQSGRQELVANYKNSLRHGEWKYYNEKGEYLYSLNYNEGKLLNPEVRDSIDNIVIQNLEKRKGTILDPEKFMEDPSEYMLKMKIYK